MLDDGEGIMESAIPPSNSAEKRRSLSSGSVQPFRASMSEKSLTSIRSVSTHAGGAECGVDDDCAVVSQDQCDALDIREQDYTLCDTDEDCVLIPRQCCGGSDPSAWNQPSGVSGVSERSVENDGRWLKSGSQLGIDLAKVTSRGGITSGARSEQIVKSISSG